MIVGDEKLDRRKLRDRAKDRSSRVLAAGAYNQNGFPTGKEKIFT